MKTLKLGGLTQTPTTKTKEYPRLDTPESRPLVDKLMDAEVKAADAKRIVDDLKADVRELTRPAYLRHCAGRIDIPTSMEVVGSSSNSVLVEFQNKTSGLPGDNQDEALRVLETILGGPVVDLNFHERAELKLDTASIPEDKIEPLFADIVAVLTKHGCAGAAKLNKSVRPSKEWWTKRHQPVSDAERQDPEQIVQRNLRAHAVCPYVEAVKNKANLKGK